MPPKNQLAANNTTDREYQLAATVAPHVALENITLVAVAAALKSQPKDMNAMIAKGGVPVRIRWNADHAMADSGSAVSVKIDFNFEFGPEEPKELKDGGGGIELTCGYVLDYALDAPPPEDTRNELMTAFAKVNGVYNAWPYLRELVQNTFARMNFPPPVLPVYRVIRPSQKAKAVSSTESKQASPPEAKSG